MSEEEQSWKEKAMQAIEILKKISQPPLEYATIVGIQNDAVEIARTSGNTMVVNYDPRLKNKFEIGQTVALTPETMAVVSIQGDVKARCATTVDDILEDGRVKINERGMERIIQTSVEGLKPGDSILVDASYSVVVENLGNHSKAYKIDQVPEIPWTSIGGLEQSIEQIRTVVEYPSLHKELYKKFPGKKPAKGVLLYGPPGCGKTMLGKGMAYNMALQRQKQTGGELNGHFLYAGGPEFLVKWIGDGEKKVREVFSAARETCRDTGDPVVMFFDEPESVLRTRGTGISSDATDSLVNQFLIEMDGLNPTDNITVVFASNRPELLDSAVVRPGRVDHKIYVPRPNQEAAQQIFALYLKDLPLEKKKSILRTADPIPTYAKHAAEEVFGVERPMLTVQYNDGQTETLDYCNIFSGASAVSIVNRATDFALLRGIQGKRALVTLDDISNAVEAEFQENRDMTNQVTQYDIKEVAGKRYDDIVSIRPAA